ncbi:MAG: putative glucokinase [Rhodospirillales bacterium]|nr:putative glucokinase [Rhodospirillales bacterium]
MADTTEADAPALAGHGAAILPTVTVDAYNAELRDSEGFIGDRASNRAFRGLLEEWRERLRKYGDDPLGETPSDEISKKKLDKLLAEGEPEEAAVVQSAIEEFAQELASIVRRLLRLKSWRDTERIVVGGGLRDSRVGELAIGRTSLLLKADGHTIDLVPIRHHPDEAGLLGCLHLAPSWMFKGHDSILAVDIGGSNVRAGLVKLGGKKAPVIEQAEVVARELWRHADEEKAPKRNDAVERIVGMLEKMIGRAASDGLKLAPFVGVGCPGLIVADGSIERGGQNLPGGNWESPKFNLPRELRERLPKIDGHAAAVLMHNDAVVQGLSESPFQRDVAHWGVLTIGTGLGNARFTNHDVEDVKAK